MKSIWICIICFSVILSLCIGKDDETTESSDENDIDELSVGDRRIRRKSCKVGEQDGICTILDGCQHYLNLIKSKERVEYKPFVDRATNACVQKRRNQLVCCPLGDQPYQLPILNTSNKTVTEIAPTPVPKASVNSVIPEPGVCGVSSGLMPRIVNGTRAKFGQLPWMAAIGVKEPTKFVDKWFCGGFLVTNRHVISAAHCKEEITPDLVRLGDLELRDEDDNAEPVDVAINQFLPHPKFDKHTLDNDIALLTLDRDVAFTDRIRPICFPWNAEEWRKLDFGKFKPYVAGWGSTETFEFYSDKMLRIAQLGIINNNDCRDRFQTDDGDKPLLDNSKICTLETGKDACQGDSGGPLMVERALPHIKKVYFAIGVISFGKYCAEGYPGVYTRLDHYVDWLKSELQNKTTSPKIFKMNLPRRKIESGLESVSFIIDYVSKNDLTNDIESTKMLNNLQQWKDRMKKKLETLNLI